MQKFNFSTGGFVIHKIPCGAGKLSAWYDISGNLLDIEKFDKNGRKTGAGIMSAMDRARIIGKREASCAQN